MNGSKSKAQKSKFAFALVQPRYELAFLLDMITRKNGAPINAVTIPTGASEAIAPVSGRLRAIRSAAISSVAPVKTLAGTRRR